MVREIKIIKRTRILTLRSTFTIEELGRGYTRFMWKGKRMWNSVCRWKNIHHWTKFRPPKWPSICKHLQRNPLAKCYGRKNVQNYQTDIWKIIKLVNNTCFDIIIVRETLTKYLDYQLIFTYSSKNPQGCGYAVHHYNLNKSW